MADCFQSQRSCKKYHFLVWIRWINLFNKSFRDQWNHQNQSKSRSSSSLVWFPKSNVNSWLAKKENFCWSMGLCSRKMGCILHAKGFLRKSRSIANSEHIRSNPSRIQLAQRHKSIKWKKTIHNCRHQAVAWIHAQWLPNCNLTGRRNSDWFSFPV